MFCFELSLCLVIKVCALVDIQYSYVQFTMMVTCGRGTDILVSRYSSPITKHAMLVYTQFLLPSSEHTQPQSPTSIKETKNVHSNLKSISCLMLIHLHTHPSSSSLLLPPLVSPNLMCVCIYFCRFVKRPIWCCEKGGWPWRRPRGELLRVGYPTDLLNWDVKMQNFYLFGSCFIISNAPDTYDFSYDLVAGLEKKQSCI